MKKTIFILLMFLCVQGSAQELPYAKILTMDHYQLLDAKFKHNSNKNQYVLKKKDGWQVTSNILSTISGEVDDIRPGNKSYEITVQCGELGIAYVMVKFHDPATYHELLNFAGMYGQDLLQTTVDNLSGCQFRYDDYVVQLKSYRHGVHTTSTNTAARAKTFDDSYNTFYYILHTGVEPNSQWIQQQAKKQAKRDAKGKKKQNVADLM